VPRPPQSQPPPRSLLRIRGAVSDRSRKLLVSTWTGLPLELSSPVQVAFLPGLTAYRGKLLSRADRGTPVYAASFIRQRRIVIEQDLLSSPAVLRFILVHEFFHFVWVRLGNTSRAEYSRLLVAELVGKARGELGESSAVKKAELQPDGKLSPPSKLWRDYACESFCDSAASIFTQGPVHEGARLGKAWSKIRRQWLLQKLADRCRWAV
jgi:hypothetical protein